MTLAVAPQGFPAPSSAGGVPFVPAVVSRPFSLPSRDRTPDADAKIGVGNLRYANIISPNASVQDGDGDLAQPFRPPVPQPYTAAAAPVPSPATLPSGTTENVDANRHQNENGGGDEYGNVHEPGSFHAPPPTSRDTGQAAAAVVDVLKEDAEAVGADDIASTAHDDTVLHQEQQPHYKRPSVAQQRTVTAVIQFIITAVIIFILLAWYNPPLVQTPIPPGGVAAQKRPTDFGTALLLAAGAGVVTAALPYAWSAGRSFLSGTLSSEAAEQRKRSGHRYKSRSSAR